MKAKQAPRKLEYVAAELEAGLAGYKQMKAACLESSAAQEAFGNINIQIYEEMLAYQEKIKNSPILINTLNGLIASISNLKQIDQAQYDEYLDMGVFIFIGLRYVGFSPDEAKTLIAPLARCLEKKLQGGQK